MPLNPEERYIQTKYELKNRSKPSDEELAIALLEQRLEHAQNTIQYLDDYVEEQTKKIDQVEGVCKKYQLGRQSEDEFSYRVLRIMGWTL